MLQHKTKRGEINVKFNHQKQEIKTKQGQKKTELFLATKRIAVQRNYKLNNQKTKSENALLLALQFGGKCIICFCLFLNVTSLQ